MAKQQKQATESTPEAAKAPVADAPAAPTPVMAAAPDAAPRIADVTAADAAASQAEMMAAAEPSTAEELLRDMGEAVNSIESMEPPEHLSRDEIHERLVGMAVEMEREIATVATSAPAQVLEALANVVTRLRARAAHFGPVPVPPTRFRVLAPVRHVINGAIHTLAKDSVVSEATHDLATLRAAGAHLVAVEP